MSGQNLAYKHLSLIGIVNCFAPDVQFAPEVQSVGAPPARKASWPAAMTRPHHRPDTWRHPPTNSIFPETACQRRAVHTRPVNSVYGPPRLQQNRAQGCHHGLGESGGGSVLSPTPEDLALPGPVGRALPGSAAKETITTLRRGSSTARTPSMPTPRVRAPHGEVRCPSIARGP